MLSRDEVRSVILEHVAARLNFGDIQDVHIHQKLNRPFSTVFRCSLIYPDQQIDVYIKFHKNLKQLSPEEFADRIQKEYDNLRSWADMFEVSQNFHVIRPLVVIPEKHCTVTLESKGSSFYEMIDAGARRWGNTRTLPDLILAAEQIGGWVSYKNSITTVDGQFYTQEELFNYLQVRFDIFSQDPRRKFDLKLAEAIPEFIRRKWPLVSQSQLLLTQSHSDFNPGNILVDGHHVTVLDFGRLKNDSYLLDVVKLYHALILWTFKPHYHPQSIRTIQKSLLKGFGEPDLEQSPMFKFMLIRNIITHLTNISRFWKWNTVEQLYNRWVMKQEMKLLRSIIRDD